VGLPDANVRGLEPRISVAATPTVEIVGNSRPSRQNVGCRPTRLPASGGLFTPRVWRLGWPSGGWPLDDPVLPFGRGRGVRGGVRGTRGNAGRVPPRTAHTYQQPDKDNEPVRERSASRGRGRGRSTGARPELGHRTTGPLAITMNSLRGGPLADGAVVEGEELMPTRVFRPTTGHPSPRCSTVRGRSSRSRTCCFCNRHATTTTSTTIYNLPKSWLNLHFLVFRL